MLQWFNQTNTVSPSVFSKGWRRSPPLSPCASSPIKEQRSPQCAKEFPSPVKLSVTSVSASLTTQQVAKRKRQYYGKTLHYLQKVDHIMKKNLNLSLQTTAQEVNIPVSLLSNWKKKYDNYLLLSSWKRQHILYDSIFWFHLKKNCSKKFHCERAGIASWQLHYSHESFWIELIFLCQRRDSSNFCHTVFYQRTWICLSRCNSYCAA